MTVPRAGDSRETAPVRIFVDPSGYACRNIGDAAMLEVAIGRLRSFWPHGRLTIHSLDGESVRRLDPAVEPLDPSGSRGWSADAALAGGSGPLASLADRSLNWCRLLRRRAPRAMGTVARTALRAGRRNPRLVGDYLEAVRGADLLLVTGAGALTDSFKPHALILLETIELAAEANVVTALVGQGIGPMSDPALRTRAAEILPRADFIALRDGAESLALAEAMGVSADRLAVTGDDAIALAYAARQDTLGSAIGVNLRTAAYSGVGSNVVEGVAGVVRDAARRHAAPLVAVPVSRYAEHDDLRTARRLIGDTSPLKDGSEPSTPAQLLRILRDCRVVVAGSYHAAVFALSMGIPAVTIAASDYYAHKFRGLTHQFGRACRMEVTAHPDFAARLRAAIDEAWRSVPATRSQLLDAAAHQITLSEAAYRRVFDLVERRRGRPR